MTLSDFFAAEHKEIRRLAGECRDAVSAPTKLADKLRELQTFGQRHFHREDRFYRRLDDGKRVEDRGSMHQMRNDHAAVIFTLESLQIRLRKTGPNPDWLQRFQTLIDLLLPHLDKEETAIYPLASKLLSPQDLATLLDEIRTVE